MNIPGDRDQGDWDLVGKKSKFKVWSYEEIVNWFVREVLADTYEEALHKFEKCAYSDNSKLLLSKYHPEFFALKV